MTSYILVYAYVPTYLTAIVMLMTEAVGSYKRSAQIFQSTRCRGTWWRSWLRRCATSRKVAGSIPDGVIEIFH